MTDRNQRYGRPSALGLFVLVAGIMLMHAVVFAACHGGSSGAHTGHPPAVTMAMSGTPASISSAEHPSDADAAHTSMHACVFVLSALALALGLILVAWLGADPGDTAGPAARARLSRQPRPPPWTVLSLPELSILRI
ncbi:DUF6153 family protein [Nocardia pseudobrasiliensis]|uniref:Uncharacterized protein n=1 Tax=Nocardia pseudobrasiliensis TaxID=45979 RepID=A0A370I8E5_9NOCA|nr:DUF6153 family protein [Nocardia pseudobrasiliensis]RDI66880.1 hypothetical protein DFR76_104633 [Nocardia pseudobrasiliensis]